MSRIKLAKCNLKRMEEILQETHHDVTAFLGSVGESVGEDSRFIHLGMTSSDVMDTALSLQLMEASDILLHDIKDLITVLGRLAIKHKYTVMIGRTHGVHAEPITFGLKLAIWVEEMRRNRQRLIDAKKNISVGKFRSGRYLRYTIAATGRNRLYQTGTPAGTGIEPGITA
jgi:adenylosuccinate lyase